MVAPSPGTLRFQCRRHAQSPHAAQKAGVERFVYTSTVGCIGVPPEGVGDENQPCTLEEMSGDYKRSKFQAEQVALEFARGGFPVVIVNPTAPIGDHDFKPTPTGKIVLDFITGKMPAYIDTGLNLVDARDVASGTHPGRGARTPRRAVHPGLRESDLEADSGPALRHYRKESPNRAASLCRGVCGGRRHNSVGRVSGPNAMAPLEAVKMAKKKMFVTHAKAARELGYAPGRWTTALRRAVEWFGSR